MNKIFLTSLLLANLAALPAAQADTHLGQPSAASHVTLTAKNIAVNNTCGMASFAKKALFRVNADGTTGAAAFTVPAGQNLVITDVEWTAQGGFNSVAPLIANLPLRFSINLQKGANNTTVFTSAGHFVETNLNLGIFGGSEHINAGIVAGPGTTLCPQAYQESQSSWLAANLTRITLHGYLTP